MTEPLVIFTTHYYFEEDPQQLFSKQSCIKFPVSTPDFQKELLIHFLKNSGNESLDEYVELIKEAVHESYLIPVKNLLKQNRLEDIITNEKFVKNKIKFNEFVTKKLRAHENFNAVKEIVKYNNSPVYAFACTPPNYPGDKLKFLKALIAEVLCHHNEGRGPIAGDSTQEIYLIVHDKDWPNADKKSDLEIIDEKQIAEIGLTYPFFLRCFVFMHERGTINDMIVNFPHGEGKANEEIVRRLDEMTRKTKIKELKEDLMKAFFISKTRSAQKALSADPMPGVIRQILEHPYINQSPTRKRLVTEVFGAEKDIASLSYSSVYNLFDKLLSNN